MNGLSATFLFMLFVVGVITGNQPHAMRLAWVPALWKQRNLGLLTHVEKGKRKKKSDKEESTGLQLVIC